MGWLLSSPGGCCKGMLTHQQRSRLPSRLYREAVPIDQAHTPGKGVDAQPGPGQIQERHPRMHDKLDVSVDLDTTAQQLHRPLGHEWRTRHRVEYRSMGLGGGDQSGHDGVVHRLEIFGVLVDGVETAVLAEGVDAGMAIGSGPAPVGTMGGNGITHRSCEQLRSGGAEAYHHDLRGIDGTHDLALVGA